MLIYVIMVVGQILVVFVMLVVLIWNAISSSSSGSRGIRNRKPGWIKRRSSKLKDVEAQDESEGGIRHWTLHIW